MQRCKCHDRDYCPTFYRFLGYDNDQPVWEKISKEESDIISLEQPTTYYGYDYD